MRSHTCTEVIAAKPLLCYLFANVVFNNCFYCHDASQRDSQKCRPFIIRNSQQKWKCNTTSSIYHSADTKFAAQSMDATSGVGSARPTPKQQRRSQSTNLSSEDPAADGTGHANYCASHSGCSPKPDPRASAIQRCWSGTKSGHFRRWCF